MRRERAEDVDELHLMVGDRVDLESLRAAVVPPHVILVPFLETPAWIEAEGERGLDEDGVHGSVYRLHAHKPGRGQLIIGFRDPRTGEVTHQKAIRVAVD